MISVLDKKNGENKVVKAVFASSDETINDSLLHLFDQNKKEYFYVKNPAKKGSKNLELDPENGKSFSKAERMARSVKADLMGVIGSSKDKFGLAIKYKRRYKFLTSDQMGILYVNFLAEKSGPKNANSYILTTRTNSSLISKIATGNGIDVKVINGDIDDIKKATCEFEGNLLFACDSNFKFIFNTNDEKDKRGLTACKEMICMSNYYLEKGMDLYEVYKSLETKHGINRTKKMTRSESDAKKDKIIKNLLKAKSFNGVKVKEKIKCKWKNSDGTSSDFAKIILTNMSSISIKEASNENMDIFVELVGGKNEKLLDIIQFENIVNEWITDKTESIEDKGFTKKGVLKYLVFIAFLAIFIFIVFRFIYDNSKASSESIFSIASAVVDKANIWMWLSVWVWLAFTRMLGAWMQKRMFMVQGVHVKARHLAISALMGTVIAFITPFAVGGDAIGYWYLRRKGVKRSALIATFASSTIWGETRFALQTILLAAIGWKVYAEIFSSTDPETKAAFIWFIIGLIWSFFAAFMLLLLTLNKTIQQFILINSVKFLEWFRFTHVYDPQGKIARFQYEFSQMRMGTKKIWSKWYFILEIAIYDLFPLFVRPIFMIFASTNLINMNVPTGPYWSQIIVSDIVGTANSMSITPGGSGTGEWLAKVTTNFLYHGTSFENTSGFSPKTIASAIDLKYKVQYAWPEIIFSALTIFTVILTQRKKRIFNLNIRTIKLIALISWLLILSLFILLFVFRILL